MRRLATAAVLPCSVALFIVLAPIAAADETTPSTTTTTTAPTTTTEPGDTTTAPPTTTVPVPRGPKLIQPGVTIGGLLVGVFPANVKMAVDWRHRPTPQKALAFGRLPLQVPLVLWARNVARNTESKA